MTAASEDLADKRLAAIEASGWGRKFHFFQPRNAAFWVYVVLVAIGTVELVTMIAGASGAYGPAITASVIVFAVYGALFWWFTQRIDRYASQPAKLIVVAFLWGGMAATWAMAAHANEAMRSMYAKFFGQVFYLDWGAGLAAPFTEEIAKGAGLVLLIALAPRLIRTAYDGFILGAFIGLGFQIVEDVVYGLSSAGKQFGANQLESIFSTLVLRMGVGVAAHILYSAIFCAGLVYLLGRPAEPRNVGRGLALIAIPVVLHFVWDADAALIGGNELLLVPSWIVIIAIALFVVVRVFKMTVPRERQFMRDVMAPEVESGVITTAELAALSGDRKARKAYHKAAGSRGERRRADHILDAAHDLADALAVARGRDTPEVEFARAEVARIRSGAPPVKQD
ncbi:PrsW family intramembrane metalloprotease [Gordonia sp. LSe1-13]|uniref:PrsW family intramembrane metalloprotease n=1 Tax=Gordonia sesuvii TaxID=3116777 RepID=A0ABU7MFQ9_9ACTN|nr:PrsW family intramembrane metalloprotease [Gordonia sp. LSe1-13]